jgi:RimJ/RimL family protein N-acetyltransferase
MLSVPVLNTDRLVLRGHRTEDLPSCAAMWADPVVTRYIGGVPLTQEESWSRLLRYIGHWASLNSGYWVVEDKSTGEFLGEVGFSFYKRELNPPLEEIPEVGWVFTTGASGRGYATEATLGVLAWGDVHLESRRFCCLIHPENVTSIRVAEKCGFRQSYRATYKLKPALVFIR